MFGFRVGVPIEFADLGMPVGLTNGASLARRFVVPFTDTLQEVRFAIMDVLGTLQAGDILCEIRNDQNGLPGDVIVSSRTLDDDPNQRGAISAMGLNVQVQANTPYWFCIKNDSRRDDVWFSLMSGMRCPLFLCDHYSAFSLDGINWSLEGRFDGTLVFNSRTYGIARIDAGSISVGNARENAKIGFQLVTPIALNIVGVMAAVTPSNGWYTTMTVTGTGGTVHGVYRSEPASDNISLFASAVTIPANSTISLEFDPVESIAIESMEVRLFRDGDSRLYKLIASRLSGTSFYLNRKRSTDGSTITFEPNIPVASLLLRW